MIRNSFTNNNRAKRLNYMIFCLIGLKKIKSFKSTHHKQYCMYIFIIEGLAELFILVFHKNLSIIIVFIKNCL